MKKMFVLFVVVLSFILFDVISYTQPVPKRSIDLNEDQIFESLVVGTKSCNKGLCASCVYLMGELCCKKSVIPLMYLLHNSECDEVRILAALSLCKIGDARGIFAVKRSSTFDESERVRRLCSLFYKSFAAGKVPSGDNIEET